RPSKMRFSRLKSILKVNREQMNPDENKAELPQLCDRYQEAIVQTLRIKTEEVITKILNQKVKTFSTPIVLRGGVACNSRLRPVMKESFKNVHGVKPLYSTDNAAMVANWAKIGRAHV